MTEDLPIAVMNKENASQSVIVHVSTQCCLHAYIYRREVHGMVLVPNAVVI